MSKKFERKINKDEFVSEKDDSIIICRCEEITKGEIRKAIYDGMTTINEIKRYLRAGMGLCQGQTCTRLIRSIICKELKLKQEEIDVPTPRAPARPITMEKYSEDGINK